MKALRFTADALLMLLAAVSIPITGPLLVLWLAYQSRKQRREVPQIVYQPTEGHHEPRNSSDETPPENHAA
jgi:hypothetical protein